MNEIFVLYGLVAVQSDGNAFLTALPIVVSAIVAVIGVYMSILLRNDNKKKAEAEQRAIDAANKLDEEKERIDTLSLGQEWVVAALDRAEKDNERLRGHLALQQADFDERIKGWQKRVSEQEDKIILLETENAQFRQELKELKKRLEII
jgi:hypothetical protein